MRPIHARHLPLAAVLLAAPAEFTPERTTTVRLHVGGGRFALIPRDCSGEPPEVMEVEYGEIAGELRHRHGEWVFGLRGGVVGHDYSSGKQSTGWINPYVGAEWPWIGLSTGWFGNEDPLPIGEQHDDDIPISAHVRLGPRRHPHATFDLASADPLYSSGGVVALGGGLETRAGHYFWAGIAGEPFDRSGLALRADVRARERLDVLLRARLGESEGVDEFAVSAGLGWRVSP
jgi:hypothetical protein